MVPLNIERCSEAELRKFTGQMKTCPPSPHELYKKVLSKRTEITHDRSWVKTITRSLSLSVSSLLLVTKRQQQVAFESYGTATLSQPVSRALLHLYTRSSISISFLCCSFFALNLFIKIFYLLGITSVL